MTRGLGERYVALQRMDVALRDDAGALQTIRLAAGDVIPEGVTFRHPQAHIDAGRISVYREPSGPGRKPKSVTLPSSSLGTPVPDRQAAATADAAISDRPLGDPGAPKKDWSEVVAAAQVEQIKQAQAARAEQVVAATGQQAAATSSGPAARSGANPAAPSQ